MEVAIILSSLAGAAAAATINKLPKSKKPILLGANSQLKAQIESLYVEKEILTKAISRLYSDDAGLTKIQHDRLLSRYQHQLGIILGKIEKLQEASRYPDLGPLGEGLMSLMDQKLASLDKKLIEISSKISAGQKQIQQKEKKTKEPEPQVLPKQPEEPHQTKQVVGSESIDEMIDSFAKAKKKLELTTLTEIPQGRPPQPEILAKPLPEIHLVTQPLAQTPNTINPKAEIVSQQITRLNQKESQPVKPDLQQESTQKETHQESKKEIEEPPVDSDEDELDSIKREILKTLSKLEQAEVE